MLRLIALVVVAGVLALPARAEANRRGRMSAAQKKALDDFRVKGKKKGDHDRFGLARHGFHAVAVKDVGHETRVDRAPGAEKKTARFVARQVAMSGEPIRFGADEVETDGGTLDPKRHGSVFTMIQPGKDGQAVAIGRRPLLRLEGGLRGKRLRFRMMGGNPEASMLVAARISKATGKPVAVEDTKGGVTYFRNGREQTRRKKK